MPQSKILISQEWLTTLARWKLVAESGKLTVYTHQKRDAQRILATRNNLPYVSKWEAMEDIESSTLKLDVQRLSSQRA